MKTLNLRSPTQASNVLITANRMFGRCLRSVVAEYEHGGDIEAELADLRQILGSAHQGGRGLA